MSTPVPEVCLCGRPMAHRRQPLSPATTCSYWCSLVKRGTFTLAQVEPMLRRERGPIAAEPERDDLFGGVA